jgi:hypothetical protein
MQEIMGTGEDEAGLRKNQGAALNNQWGTIHQLDFPSVCLQMMLGGLICHGIHLLVLVRCPLATPQISTILKMKNWGMF